MFHFLVSQKFFPTHVYTCALVYLLCDSTSGNGSVILFFLATTTLVGQRARGQLHLTLFLHNVLHSMPRMARGLLGNSFDFGTDLYITIKSHTVAAAASLLLCCWVLATLRRVSICLLALKVVLPLALNLAFYTHKYRVLWTTVSCLLA